MSRPHVLIADDEEYIRDVYTRAFADAGMMVHTAQNGQECVDLALQHHPDLILIDINMPDMDGHQAISHIRSDDWGKNANVIYLTNFSDPEHVVSAVEHDSHRFIVKANTTVKEVVNQARLAMHAG